MSGHDIDAMHKGDRIQLLVFFVLLYFHFGSLAKCLIVLLSVPFSKVGEIWLVYLLGYNLRVAVWTRIITLAGVGAETSVVMIVYLDEGLFVGTGATPTLHEGES